MNPSQAFGNDVVWLSDPANVGRHSDQRLLNRILTPTERFLVLVSPQPDRMLWSLWAAKEAAFKAWSRQSPALVFAPIRFEVEMDTVKGGATVRLGRDWLTVLWTSGSDWVHATAATTPLDLTVKVESGQSGHQGIAVRELAVRALVEAGAPRGSVEGQPPRYVGEGIDVPLSLSHDGPYVAVVFPRQLTSSLQR